MKAKLMLLVLAAVGSTALVASGQTPSTAYVVTSSDDGLAQELLRVAPPAPPAPPSAMAPVPAPPGLTVRPGYFSGQQGLFGHVFSPEDNGLARQAETLAQQLAGAKSDSDREKIKGQLVDLLEKQFDKRQKRHEDEIKQLEAQIKKLRDQMEKRQENRREIVAARLDQILKEAQGLGW